MDSSSENQMQSQIHDDHKDEHQHSTYAMNLLGLGLLPMALRAAVQLDIFRFIAEGGPDAKLSPQEIASRLATTNPDTPMMLDRILRLLATHDVVTCSLVVDPQDGHPSRLYGLAPAAKYFIQNEDGVSLQPFLNFALDKVMMDSWSQLKGAIVEGGTPFERVHGMKLYEYAAKDSGFNETFNSAMLNHSTFIIKGLLDFYKGFEHVNQLVDVGGGLGVALSLITAKYPSIKGINFDLPHVVKNAPSYPGVQHVGGNMFENVPKGDAIFMQWILHNWSDDLCIELLKNCYDAIPNDGKVIVVEAVVPELPKNDVASMFATIMDVAMMNVNPGGKERTEHEFIKLATVSGFSGIKFKCFAFNFTVMEFFK